jgi:TolB-like protein
MPQKALSAPKRTSGSRFEIHRPNEIPPEHIRAEVAHILATQAFSRSDRPGRFLKFLVEHALSGEAGKIDEYLLAVEVFGRKPDFDAGSDPIVRVEASRLRRKLQEYYESEGRDHPVVIELPQRTYVPVFYNRQPPLTQSFSKDFPIRRLRTLKFAVLLLAVPLIAWIAYWAATGHPVWKGAPAGTAGKASSVRPGAPSIVVLPFADLSPKQDEEYLCDGLAEELVETLSEVEGLQVVSRTTASQFKRSAQDVRAIGRQLNAALVLEGSVRKEGDRLRIAVQLINAANGYQVWSRRYDRQAQADFAVEEEIARDIATSVSAAQRSPGYGISPLSSGSRQVSLRASNASKPQRQKPQ